jgi:hypothetical protein
LDSLSSSLPLLSEGEELFTCSPSLSLSLDFSDHVVKAKLQEKDEELKNLKEMVLSIQQEQKEMRDSLRMRNKVLDTMLTT